MGNSLLEAIELEGLGAYFIHGTKKAVPIHGIGPNWSDKVNSGQLDFDYVKQIGKIFGNTQFNNSFNWNGKNTYAARHKAAEKLVKHILDTKANNGQPITLIGHSHGGNVAIEAANSLIEKHGMSPDQINIVAINTPRKRDIELRHTNVNMYNVNCDGDLVQLYGSDALGLITFMDDIDPRHADRVVTYKSQYEKDYMKHYGCGPLNVELWIKALEQAVEEHESARTPDSQ